MQNMEIGMQKVLSVCRSLSWVTWLRSIRLCLLIFFMAKRSLLTLWRTRYTAPYAPLEINLMFSYSSSFGVVLEGGLEECVEDWPGEYSELEVFREVAPLAALVPLPVLSSASPSAAKSSLSSENNHSL